jgi:hypothetical protein
MTIDGFIHVDTCAIYSSSFNHNKHVASLCLKKIFVAYYSDADTGKS